MVDHLPSGRTFGKEDSGTIAMVWSKSHSNDLFFQTKAPAVTYTFRRLTIAEKS